MRNRTTLYSKFVVYLFISGNCSFADAFVSLSSSAPSCTLCMHRWAAHLSQRIHGPYNRLLRRHSDTVPSSLLPLSALNLTGRVSDADIPTLSSSNENTTIAFLSHGNQESYDTTRKMIQEITAIAVPSLGGMLIDPFMSLLDTACVGQISMVQLAALAPCTSIYQFLFLACFFLSATTTNLVAANSRPTSCISILEQQTEYNERVVSSACVLAVGLGLILTTVLLLFGKPLLFLAAGGGNGNMEMMRHAERYLSIRALGLPFVLVAMVLQGASLGSQDAMTPLKIFAAAGVLNLVGDVILTLHMGLGAVGAAIATTASQAIAAVYYVVRSMKVKPTKKRIQSHTPETLEMIPNGVRLAWRGPPTRTILRAFIPVAVTVMLRECGNMAAYSLMTRKAAKMGAIALAAHQVTLQTWWLLSYIPEPLATAAQTLIARDRHVKPWRVPKLVRTLFRMTTGVGFVVALLTGAVLLIPSLAKTLVAEPSVRTLLQRTAPYAMLAQMTCCVGEMSGGICVGAGDFRHLPASAIGSTAVLAVFLNLFARRDVGTIWLLSNIFFAVRFLLFLLISRKSRTFVFSKAHDHPRRQ